MSPEWRKKFDSIQNCIIKIFSVNFNLGHLYILMWICIGMKFNLLVK